MLPHEAEDVNQLDFNKAETLDELMRFYSSSGSNDRAVTNTLYGLNSTGVKSVVPQNQDMVGYVFFTRPLLNLTTYNIRNVRQMYNLLTTDENSIYRYVRCMLDPRLQRRELNEDFWKTLATGGFPGHKQFIDCPLVHTRCAFIPVLTNTITSLTGWPDKVITAFNTPEGLMREQWGIADSSTAIYNNFTLNATFENIANEPLTALFDTWIDYMANVFSNMMSPYIDMIVENEIDYNTRIYVLVMDSTRRYVKKIAATGASFPLNSPSGKYFDFNKGSVFSDTKEHNIQFNCYGAQYNDYITIKEFNYSCSLFDQPIQDMLNLEESQLMETRANRKSRQALFQQVTTGSNMYYKVPRGLLSFFSYAAIPLINFETTELEWWIKGTQQAFKDFQRVKLRR